MKKETEVQQVWNDFWKDIVTTKTGKIKLMQLKRELYDFKIMVDNVSEVYCECTGGRISKPNTNAKSVIAEIKNHHEELYREEEKRSSK